MDAGKITVFDAFDTPLPRQTDNTLRSFFAESIHSYRLEIVKMVHRPISGMLLRRAMKQIRVLFRCICCELVVPVEHSTSEIVNSPKQV